MAQRRVGQMKLLGALPVEREPRSARPRPASPALRTRRAAEAPEAAALVRGERLQRWQGDVARELLQSERGCDVWAALGLLVRLWAPLAGATEAAARARNDDTPADRAVRWAAAVPRQAAHEVERDAAVRARELARSIGDLVGRGGHGPAYRRAVVRWLHSRDDLEGVALLLGKAGAGASLRKELDRADQVASSYLTQLSCVDLSGDARLRRVSWCDPDAWWGGLVQASDPE